MAERVISELSNYSYEAILAVCGVGSLVSLFVAATA